MYLSIARLNYFTKTLFIVSIPVFLLACSGISNAPVSSRGQQTTKTVPPAEKSSVPESVSPGSKQKSVKATAERGFHIVSKGETLYSIAWRYGYDFRQVAKWNSINSPYVIYPEQVIRLKPLSSSKQKVLQPGPVVAKEDKASGKKIDSAKGVTKQAAVAATKPPVKKTTVKKKPAASGKINWQWPVKGRILKLNSVTSKNGLDIGGTFGQEIKSAASGSVVYSGSGLLGYGRLIIIKHNETYLSAYAHNSELMVQEGDEVTAGQKIARMGKNSNGQALLHFEIRKNGKSVNPSTLLPGS